MSYNYWWMGFNKDKHLECLQIGDSMEIEAKGDQKLKANVNKLRIGDLVIAYEGDPERRFTSVLVITEQANLNDENPVFRVRKVCNFKKLDITFEFLTQFKDDFKDVIDAPRMGGQLIHSLTPEAFVDLLHYGMGWKEVR